MTPPSHPSATALGALFEALDDAEIALRSAHPELALDPTDDPGAALPPAELVADAVLLLIENLRAAARAYHRHQHLTAILPLL